MPAVVCPAGHEITDGADESARSGVDVDPLAVPTLDLQASGQFNKTNAYLLDSLDEDMEQAQELNVTGTPAFFINGRFLSGAQPFENFKRAIDAAIERAS